MSPRRRTRQRKHHYNQSNTQQAMPASPEAIVNPTTTSTPIGSMQNQHDAILSMQRRRGNRYVQQQLTEQPTSALGAQRYTEGTVIPYQRPPAATGPKDQAHSVHHNPYEGIMNVNNAAAQSVEDSPVGNEIQTLVDAIKGDIKDWQQFRAGDYDMSPYPGTRSANSAKELKRAIMYLQHNQYASSEVRSRGINFYRAYLRKKLNGVELANLQDMVRFASSVNRTSNLSVALSDIMGVSMRPVQHTYHLQVVTTNGAGAGAILSAGAYLREMIVHYQNDVGMSYKARINSATAKLGAAAGASFGKGLKDDKAKGGLSDKLTPDNVIESANVNLIPNADAVLRAAKNEDEAGIAMLPQIAGTNDFWKPSELEGGFSTFKGSASAGAKLGPVQFGSSLSYKAFEIISFMEGSKSIAFNGAPVKEKGEAGEENENAQMAAVADALLNMVKDAKATGDKDTIAKVSASMGIDYEIGWAWLQEDGVTTSASEVDPLDPEIMEGWFTLRDTYLYFDTGSHEVTDDNEAEIVRLTEYLDRYLGVFPEAELSFKLTGYASPRWDIKPKKGDTADTLNLELADMRAHNVHNVLEQHRAKMLTAEKINNCSYETMSTLADQTSEMADQGLNQSLNTNADEEIETVGSAEALEMGKDADSDDIQDRRVHIETLIKIDMAKYDY